MCLAVIAAGTSCASGRSDLFSAEATLTCLRHRSEYARLIPSKATKRLVINAFAVMPDDTISHLVPGFSGAELLVRFTPPRFAELERAKVYFFKSEKRAQQFHAAQLRPATATTLPLIRRQLQVRGNAVVWWTFPDSSPVFRTILYGCLTS